MKLDEIIWIPELKIVIGFVWLRVNLQLWIDKGLGASEAVMSEPNSPLLEVKFVSTMLKLTKFFACIAPPSSWLKHLSNELLRIETDESPAMKMGSSFSSTHVLKLRIFN